LNRINLSLMQISERLMPSPPVPPGQGPPGMGMDSWYSFPPSRGWTANSILIKLLLALVLLLLVGAPAMWLAARASAVRAAAEERAALAEWRARSQVSPFEGVRWDGAIPHVQVGGIWYELTAVDGLSVPQVVARCQADDRQHWQKRFEEDLVEVLVRTGHPMGDRTILEVKDPETGQIKTLMDVPLTRENGEAARRAASTRHSDEP